MTQFTIPPDQVNSALLNLLADIHTQNKVLAEMFLPLYSKVNKLSAAEARESMNQYFTRRKTQTLHQLHLDYGTITMADILGKEL